MNKRSPDGKFGAPAQLGNSSSPESWSGLVKMLLDGEADFSASGVTATLERNNVVDFALIAVRVVVFFVFPRKTYLLFRISIPILW